MILVLWLPCIRDVWLLCFLAVIGHPVCASIRCRALCLHSVICFCAGLGFMSMTVEYDWRCPGQQRYSMVLNPSSQLFCAGWCVDKMHHGNASNMMLRRWRGRLRCLCGLWVQCCGVTPGGEHCSVTLWQMYNDMWPPLQHLTEYFHGPKYPVLCPFIRPAPNPWSFYLSIALPFPEYHLVRIIQNVAFLDWHFLLSDIRS